MLASESNDLAITLNDEVLSCIDLYQGPLREWFTSALARGGRYLPRIREVFAAEGVPKDLAYVALVESAFKTRRPLARQGQGHVAVHRRHRQALRAGPGLVGGRAVATRRRPRGRRRRYLKELHDMFGDWNLALAGYNWGEGRVSRWVDRTGAQDFWSLAEQATMPRETRNYVPMIHAAIVVAKAPEKYGFEVTPEPELTYESVPVQGAVDLRVIAECASTGLDSMQMLNPELRRLATPANRTFDVKVPHGRAVRRPRSASTSSPRTSASRSARTPWPAARPWPPSRASTARRSPTSPPPTRIDASQARRLARGTELIIPIPRASVPPPRRASAAPPPEMADLTDRTRAHPVSRSGRATR